MRMRHSYFLFVCLSFFLLASCNKYEKILKSNDINYKLTKANEYYDKKSYQHANELYQSILPVMKGTRNFEPMYYRYAWSYYDMKDYLSASYHFKNFVDLFPGSKDAEEMQYMYAVSLYKMSPKYSLEQTNTIKAMEAMQMYINTHPDSKRATEANKYIDDSRLKLEKKDGDAAKLYYNIGEYKAAATAFKLVMHDYPESPNADYYQYMIVKSLYYYARNSDFKKQEERYANTGSVFNEFKSSFPKSKYLRDAEDYNLKAQNSLNQLRNEHK